MVKNTVALKVFVKDGIIDGGYSDRVRDYFTDVYGHCELRVFDCVGVADGGMWYVLLLRFQDCNKANQIKQTYNGRYLFNLKVLTNFVDHNQYERCGLRGVDFTDAPNHVPAVVRAKREKDDLKQNAWLLRRQRHRGHSSDHSNKTSATDTKDNAPYQFTAPPVPFPLPVPFTPPPSHGSKSHAHSKSRSHSKRSSSHHKERNYRYPSKERSRRSPQRREGEPARIPSRNHGDQSKEHHYGNDRSDSAPCTLSHGKGGELKERSLSVGGLLQQLVVGEERDDRSRRKRRGGDEGSGRGTSEGTKGSEVKRSRSSSDSRERGKGTRKESERDTKHGCGLKAGGVSVEKSTAKTKPLCHVSPIMATPTATLSPAVVTPITTHPPVVIPMHPRNETECSAPPTPWVEPRSRSGTPVMDELPIGHTLISSHTPPISHTLSSPLPTNIASVHPIVDNTGQTGSDKATRDPLLVDMLRPSTSPPAPVHKKVACDVDFEYHKTQALQEFSSAADSLIASCDMLTSNCPGQPDTIKEALLLSLNALAMEKLTRFKSDTGVI